ncbi:MAG: N-acetyl-alpha-D-glucosaminyl L-malate synthase BshA [Planctomycetes bacterium]|nr:N-acetyl-alpha-D-glucosaminyl L-malate synthase BshA [Planctomycetota bacterium]
MNIGIVCYPTHGGSGVVATELGSALADTGHNVHVISYAMPFRFQAYRHNLSYHEVEVTAYPLFRYPPYDLALAGRIMEVVDQYGLDLIHVHYAIPHAVSALLAREMLGQDGKNIRIITTLHGTDITIIAQQKEFQRITAFGIEHSDAVTSVSDELKGRVLDVLGERKRPIEVIPNFIDTQRFTPGCCADKRRELAKPDEKIIMHVSNFRELKRTREIIHAFAKYSQKQRSRLVMVGDGPDLGACRDLALELKLRDRVTFVGTYDAIWELLPQADLFVLASEYESFGLSALEAMACGVPTLTTNAGGLPEVVKEGETGLMFNVGDINALAAAMSRMLGDDALRAKMGAAARERAVSVFAKEKILPQWHAFYKKVLS